MPHIDESIAELLRHPFYAQKLRPWGGKPARRWVVPSEDGCLLFVGATNSKGYGITRDGLVHRLAWEAINGPIPRGSEIHHICRVKTCCRIDHLLCLTKAEHRQLEARPKKLRDTQVIEIVQMLDQGVARRRIAEQFGISLATVKDIRTERSWRVVIRAFRESQPTDRAA